MYLQATCPAAREASEPLAYEEQPMDDELQAARARGCMFQQLGPRRLRAETAAIVATAVTAMRR